MAQEPPKPRYLLGNHAAAEGALAAGCRFFGGYPITPSSEIMELMARRLPEAGGAFLQLEDELASIAAVVGAAWTGAKAMTATSGPGFSLMQETFGYAVLTETPCVVVNVQRAGPATGQATRPGSGDVLQTKYGSHGDYEVIALAPNSPQECFDLTIAAFNLAETYRLPVLLMTDEVVGHMTEKVVIPEAGTIELAERPLSQATPDAYRPYEPQENLVPEMVTAGQGYRLHVTGLTHDERGYPAVVAPVQMRTVPRLVEKIRHNRDRILRYEEDGVEGADVVVVSYGITSRVALMAVEEARRRKLKVGFLRLIVAWPFPEERVRTLAAQVQGFVVPEINLGQMALEVERCAAGAAKTVLVPHAGGAVHDPQTIIAAIEEAHA